MARPCPNLLSLTDGSHILIDKPILLFGRDQECDIQLNSKKISRRHCCLVFMDERLYIRDLKSTNGVCINGQRVNSAEVQHGDRISIGNFRYRVYSEAIEEPVANGVQNEQTEF